MEYILLKLEKEFHLWKTRLLNVKGTVNVLNMQQQTSDDRCSLQRDKQRELMICKCRSIQHTA
jgi:exoribonuclease II